MRDNNNKKKEFPNIIVFDIETGGFTHEKNPIIEIAAISIDSKLKEVERFEVVVLPYGENKKYEVGALRANGFTLVEIEKRGIDSHLAMKMFVEFLERQKKATDPGVSIVPDKKPILCGHNIKGFDIPFLSGVLKEHKYDFSKFVSQKMEIDTLDWSRLFFGNPLEYDYYDHKLGTCCKNIGVNIVDAHRAMNDVEGKFKTIKILYRISKRNKCRY